MRALCEIKVFYSCKTCGLLSRGARAKTNKSPFFVEPKAFPRKPKLAYGNIKQLRKRQSYCCAYNHVVACLTEAAPSRAKASKPSGIWLLTLFSHLPLNKKNCIYELVLWQFYLAKTFQLLSLWIREEVA